MRWLFADQHNEEEAARVKEKVAAIDRWWDAFEKKAPTLEKLIAGKSKMNLAKFMEDTLQAIDPNLMWEYGPAVRQEGNRLVITPESRRFLRPMVRTILERAPKIPGWEFYPYRLAETLEVAILNVKSRVDVDITGALVDASVAPGRKVDLDFAFPNQPDLDDDTAMQAAFVAAETLMGEQVLDTWIGTIGLMDGAPLSGSRPFPLELTQAAVATLIRGCMEQLPHERTQDISIEDGWATVKLDPPEEADDYPARSDLVMASTRDMELFQAFHSGQAFTSACHSRLHEVFCYLKLDAAEIEGGQIVEFRAKFEEALNPELVAAGLGGCIGGGSGLRYAYIDLALTDVKRAAPIIRKVLSEHGAPLRSWMLFHDDDYSGEWIGIYGQTPPPPE